MLRVPFVERDKERIIRQRIIYTEVHYEKKVYNKGKLSLL